MVAFLSRVDRGVVFMFLYSFIAVCSMISPGMSMGYSSVVLPILTNKNNTITLSDTEMPWFVSLPTISQFLGCLLSFVTMKYGRRVALLSGTLISIVGWIVITSSYSTMQLFIGRFLTGLATGLCATPAVVYMAEISTKQFRTLLTSCTSLFISLGVLFVYVLGYLLMHDWRSIAAIAIIPPTILILSVLFLLPESPKWLLIRNRKEEAKIALLRIRRLSEETLKFQEEFSEMILYCERSGALESHSNSTSCTSKLVQEKIAYTRKMLSLPEVWKPLIILNAYFFFVYFTGIYVMIAYAVDIILNVGIQFDPYLTSIVIEIVQVVTLAVFTCCSTKIGRRVASIFSAAGILVSLASLIVYMQFFHKDFVPAIPLLCLVVFVVTSSFGFMAIPWAMIGELYPTKYVNILGAWTTCFASIYNFATVQLYPVLSKNGSLGAMYMFCGIAIIATFFMATFLPETRNKTKTEIEEKFQK